MWIEPYLSHSLYKSFQAMVYAIRWPIQWRPSNQKLPVCLTGNEKTKHLETWKLTAVIWKFSFFVIHLNLEKQFADYREKALIFSGHFLNKMRVPEVDNARGRGLQLLK